MEWNFCGMTVAAETQATSVKAFATGALYFCTALYFRDTLYY